jgi:peroxiredoxin
MKIGHIIEKMCRNDKGMGMLLETYELGPMLNTLAPDFALLDHDQRRQHLDDVIGSKGVLLGFVGDIWMPTSVRRIFWLQRHAHKFALSGAPAALLVRDKPHTLYGFRMSTPFPVQFPLLADTDGQVHRLYRMEHNPGLVLLDRSKFVREKWLMPDERVWPKMQELVDVIDSLPG